MSDIPRRACIDLFTPAEKAIREAIVAVEASGCDERLTWAVMALSDAQAWVADFVDGVPVEQHYPRPLAPRPPVPPEVLSSLQARVVGRMLGASAETCLDVGRAYLASEYRPPTTIVDSGTGQAVTVEHPQHPVTFSVPHAVEGDGARGGGLLPEIAAFARVMDAKVKGHNLDRGEYGWRTASPARLMEWLDRYVEALRDVVSLPSLARGPAKVTSKAASVANLAMMIADVAGDLDAAAPSEPAEAAPLPKEPVSGEHYWLSWEQMRQRWPNIAKDRASYHPSCLWCGVMKRGDGKPQRPCRGRVPIVLRAPEPESGGTTP